MPTELPWLWLVGAGGHARVVLDALREEDGIAVGVMDDRPCADLLGLPVLSPIVPARVQGARFHVAIGSNRARQQWQQRLLDAGGVAYTVVHPRAVVSRHVELGAGSFVAAAAVVAAGATVGDAVIVNHGAIVDHDNCIGDGCHIAPNATLGGGVVLGQRVLVGAGAVILPGVRVGRDVVIGAGAVVRHDVADDLVMAGVPAYEILRRK